MSARGRHDHFVNRSHAHLTLTYSIGRRALERPWWHRDPSWPTIVDRQSIIKLQVNIRDGRRAGGHHQSALEAVINVITEQIVAHHRERERRVHHWNNQLSVHGQHPVGRERFDRFHRPMKVAQCCGRSGAHLWQLNDAIIWVAWCSNCDRVKSGVPSMHSHCLRLNRCVGVRHSLHLNHPWFFYAVQRSRASSACLDASVIILISIDYHVTA